jgi:hypothetical protein
MALYLGATRNLLANGKSLLQRGCPDRDSTAESSASAEAAAKTALPRKAQTKYHGISMPRAETRAQFAVIAASSRMIYCDPANRQCTRAAQGHDYHDET